MLWAFLLGALLLATALAQVKKPNIRRNGKRLKYVSMLILSLESSPSRI
jgi:hypothetical protein